jgi:hypothetical protein
MSDEARELPQIISASVRDMLDAYRLETRAGPVSAQVLERVIFRAAHPIAETLAPYPAAELAALPPSVVRMLLAGFLEDETSAYIVARSLSRLQRLFVLALASFVATIFGSQGRRYSFAAGSRRTASELI